MGKSCEDTLALQGGLYQRALTQQNQRFEDRERLNSELFGVYIDGRNRTDALIEKNNTDHFNLYKYILVTLMMISVKSYLI